MTKRLLTNYISPFRIGCQLGGVTVSQGTHNHTHTHMQINTLHSRAHLKKKKDKDEYSNAYLHI